MKCPIMPLLVLLTAMSFSSQGFAKTEFDSKPMQFKQKTFNFLKRFKVSVVTQPTVTNGEPNIMESHVSLEMIDPEVGKQGIEVVRDWHKMSARQKQLLKQKSFIYSFKINVAVSPKKAEDMLIESSAERVDSEFYQNQIRQMAKGAINENLALLGLNLDMLPPEEAEYLINDTAKTITAMAKARSESRIKKSTDNMTLQVAVVSFGKVFGNKGQGIILVKGGKDRVLQDPTGLKNITGTFNPVHDAISTAGTINVGVSGAYDVNENVTVEAHFYGAHGRIPWLGLRNYLGLATTLTDEEFKELDSNGGLDSITGQLVVHLYRSVHLFTSIASYRGDTSVTVGGRYDITDNDSLTVAYFKGKGREVIEEGFSATYAHKIPEVRNMTVFLDYQYLKNHKDPLEFSVERAKEHVFGAGAKIPVLENYQWGFVSIDVNTFLKVFYSVYEDALMESDSELGYSIGLEVSAEAAIREQSSLLENDI